MIFFTPAMTHLIYLHCLLPGDMKYVGTYMYYMHYHKLKDKYLSQINSITISDTPSVINQQNNSYFFSLHLHP